MPDGASPFIRLTDLVGRTIVHALTRVCVDGLEHARGLTGPVIVAANHASNADGVLVASWITPAIRRRLYLLGKQEALRRLKTGLGQARTSFGHLMSVDEEVWNDDSLTFRLRALGQSANGTIDVAEDHLRLEVSLPWLLAKLSERLIPAIRKEGTMLLEKK